jgi:hypothetical protein
LFNVIFYSPSPEYPAACSRDERQGEPRRSSIERGRVRATAQFHFDTPQLAAGSFIKIASYLFETPYFTLFGKKDVSYQNLIQR